MHEFSGFLLWSRNGKIAVGKNRGYLFLIPEIAEKNTCSINTTSLTRTNEVQSASIAIAGNQQPLLNTLKTNKNPVVD